MKKNLLKETLDKMAKHDKDKGDIAFIVGRNEDFKIDLSRWQDIFNIEYDNGFGCNEIASDLLVVFRDQSWLERQVYDGSSWWEYRRPPALVMGVPFATRVKCERGDGEYTLAGMNRGEIRREQ